MISNRRLRGVTLIAFALVAFGTASFIVTRLAFGNSGGVLEAQQPGQPSREELDRAANELRTRIAEDQAKPIFNGILGDFEIRPDDRDISLSEFCSEGLPKSRGENFESSELNQQGMTEQVVCPDGRVVTTYAFGVGRRSYFAGSPKITTKAPVDRLEVTSVEGRPALIVAPPAGLGHHFVYVIQRFPSQDKPGILIAALGVGSNGALDLARRLLTE
jgi:hypothetical protein